MLKTNIDKDENEKAFQQALLENNTDKMWECVYAACTNVCKSIYAKRGFVASEDILYDKSMEATMMVMRNILERGVRPEKLSSYVYLRCLCFINGYKEDRFAKKLEEKLSDLNESFLNEYIEEELYE